MARGAGNLDERIKFQRETTTRDSAGGVGLVGWSDLFSVWAAVEFMSDSERFAASEISATITTRFVVRKSDQVLGLTPKDRVVFFNDDYDIAGIKPVKRGRKKYIEITASARNDDGT